MSEIVVADSSCLIALARSGQLDVLRVLFSQIIIPAAVYDEVVIQGAGAPGAKKSPKQNGSPPGKSRTISPDRRYV